MMKKEAEVKNSGGGAFKIIGFILGIIGILTCWIPGVNILTIIFSTVGLVFSAVALKRSEKRTIAFAGLLLNILAICIGIFVLLLFGGLALLLHFSGYSGPAGNQNFTNYSIGEKISSGNMSVTVTSAEKSKQIKNNLGQIIPVETTGYFLSVKISIENRGAGTRTLTGDPFAVIDGQGRIFLSFSDAERYYPNSIKADTQFQPGVLFNGIKIFEVPENAAGLKLKIILSDTEGAYVSLD
jgi:hypothetical protein